MYTFELLLFIAPAILLGFLAQLWIRSAYSRASQVTTLMSGMAAAREILNANGCANVRIEQVPGRLSDHYDPRHKVLRLSSDVYHGRTAAAVGIAAHEAGHALQDAQSYAPLVIRNLAVPAASFGSNFALTMMFLGVISSTLQILLPIGIAIYAGFIFFQLINLPVEYNASSRAKAQLIEHNIISQSDLPQVSRVLHAAALTYVAVTLQAILTMFYYVAQFLNQRQRRAF